MVLKGEEKGNEKKKLRNEDKRRTQLETQCLTIRQQFYKFIQKKIAM